jgi:ATPase
MAATRKFVADSSAVMDGKIASAVERGEIAGEIIVSEGIVLEFEAQARAGLESGHAGLVFLKNLRTACQKMGVELSFQQQGPGRQDSQAVARRAAMEYGATLATSDRIARIAAEAEGIEVLYLKRDGSADKDMFASYFKKDTMSVHLKEGCHQVAKTGMPGSVTLEKIGPPLDRSQLALLSENIVRDAERTSEFSIESEKKGALVAQMGQYRVVVTKPPFSDGFEITVVRPIRKLVFSDYEMSDKLRSRFAQKAEGILICGPPGSGKSTFAAAIAEFYMEKGKIVKTLENPRDLQVAKEITQYAPLDGDFENTKEILLLVRPDYSVYDEVRVLKDFMIYADLRMTGVGMIGVVHANRPIDAVHRFITKIDMGIVPQIIDTVVFIKGGRISRVYELVATVKVPMGMRERDLARPVITVRDFETGQDEYEIYKFGEETVIIGVSAEPRRRAQRGAAPNPEGWASAYFSEYELSPDRSTIAVPRSELSSMGKKELRRAEKIARRHGMRIRAV